VVDRPNHRTDHRQAQAGAVLLIDDEKPLIELFAEALSSHFECVLATSTREAGYILHKKAFKVVVCDHLMPRQTA